MDIKRTKGERVEFSRGKGKPIEYGVIEKGGSGRVKVILDGGENFVTAPAHCFKVSDHPIAKDTPSNMDHWGIVGYKIAKFASHETDCFEATITYKGNRCLHISNEGMGGPDRIYPLKPEFKAFMTLFLETVKAWAVGHGYDDPFGPESIWMEWVRCFGPYGVTAKKYIADYVADINEPLGEFVS